MDIVDDVRSGLKRPSSGFSAIGVRGNDNLAFRRQILDYRQYARLFFLRRQRIRAGPRRFAAYVDDIGTLADP